MDYSIEDLDIIDDAHEVIRRRAQMYAGPPPRGPRLASWLLRDLIDYGDLPAAVERYGDWWLVSCDTDWLKRPTRGGRDYWTHVIPTAELHGMRCEVVLRALCRGLLSATSKASDVLVGEAPPPAAVQHRVQEIVRRRSAGRVVAFCVD